MFHIPFVLRCVVLFMAREGNEQPVRRLRQTQWPSALAGALLGGGGAGGTNGELLPSDMP